LVTVVLLASILVPMLAVPALALAGMKLGHRVGWLALPVPVISCALIASLLWGAEPFTERLVTIPWIPSLGIELSFMIDGLSLFFGLVVSGMGVLVTLYASSYLDDHYRDHGRFYAYLMLFMASMLGCVFSENLLLLFVFWEMTGISSFLLIGFLHDKPDSRDGARMALFTTGGAGLAMLAGVVLLGESAGTYSLVALRDGAMAQAVAANAGLMTAALVLMMIGAFAKSAQFPFHYWLPNAMAAPTPVSAYLHSATMVKLGVFFIARVFPLAAMLEAWTPMLVGIGFLTMLLGAVFALLSHDLKAVLAYSTVSQLGFLVGYYGMSDAAGTSYDLLHVANHVFYKGCLFMVVGIVDHAAGTRDLRKLGGLARKLPVLAVIAMIATASMAGIPGTTGFISKEYMLKTKFDYWHSAGWLNWFPLVIVVVASVVKVVFSIRLARSTFFGALPHEVEEHYHKPSNWMLISPAILAACCVVFGLLPGLMSPALTLLSVEGLHSDKEIHLKLWHGLTRELGMSVGIVAAGLVLWRVLSRAWLGRGAIPRRLRFDVAFDAAFNAVPSIAKKITAMTRADRPMDYLPIILGTVFLASGGWLLWNRADLPGLSGVRDPSQLFDPLRSFIVLLVAIAVFMVVKLRRWTTQLIALGTVGFLLTFYFVLFRAPDLAMTQILVEAATLILVLMLLSRFPRAAEIGERTFRQNRGRRTLNVLVASLAGITVTAFTFVVASSKHPNPAGAFYIDQTVPAAKGSNAVNTILVDFRGFDTLMEAAVLLIATLGAIGLLMRYRRTREEYDAGPMGPAGMGVVHETDAERERWTDR
jgi:multicomponent K+:H+ antiporter subunit A/multicomponent Na+:H+ antiporter subunit A